MKPKPQQKKGHQAAAKSPSSGTSSTFLKVAKNFLLLLGAFLVLAVMKKNVDGYKWYFKNLIGDNLKTMKKYKDLTYDQKMESKLGFDYVYLNYLKKNTPEDAVILMPPDSVFFPANEKSEFKQFVIIPGWAGYFVYPRKLVYEKQNTIPLYKQVTHIAVMNSWGYDKLSYEADRRNKYNIYPVKLNN